LLWLAFREAEVEYRQLHRQVRETVSQRARTASRIRRLRRSIQAEGETLEAFNG
jgi:hypothetical protein